MKLVSPINDYMEEKRLVNLKGNFLGSKTKTKRLLCTCCLC